MSITRAALLFSLFSTAPLSAATVDGTLVVWHPLTLTFDGPEASETDSAPNPFLDIRLQVIFTGPANERFVVPGFFDGDGQGGAKGRAWRVRFSPNAAGTWRYRALFRKGPGVAIETAAEAGEPLSTTNLEGSFDVAARDPDAPGFLKWGRLDYVGKHYLKFVDGPYWIRGGTDEPENLLGYAGFDHTPPKHRYADHVADWREGDPDWGDGKGKGIIGALNSLAEQHVNSIYFLTMNIGGDGKDVWPWTGRIDPRGNSANDNLHFDLAKLRQWEIVFAYAQRRGLFLHFVFNEAEEANKRELDDGELGPERKLYYREIIARFGHHLALEWNLCEEYNLNFNFGPERVRAFADFLRAIDPYGHPITVHSAGDPVEQLRFTYGDPRFSMTSIQLNQRPIHEITEAIWRETERAGRPLPVSLDEFTLDRGQRASHIPVDDAEGHRREKLWPTYFSGGMIEFILGDLLKTDSFKTPEREKLWRYTWYARRFMEEYLPFWDMQPVDDLSSGAVTMPVGIGKGRTVPLGPQVFAKPGEIYAVYLPIASPSGTLDLTALEGTAEQRWYNPRTGEFEGNVVPVKGGERHSLGTPPSAPEADWVALIRRTGKSATKSVRMVFPGEHWQTRPARELGLDEARLDAVAQALGGRGCIVKDGFVVKTWGSQEEKSDWFSSAKPVLSTLLFFAIQEGKVASVDTPIASFGWPLSEKDRTMTFRHLANMTSGYARPEPPGAAWAYNDFAINLYQKTLFDKVFQGEPDTIANAPEHFGQLGLEDGLSFRRTNRRLSASVRDFSRIAWFWLSKGRWNGKQVLDEKFFNDYMRPHVPKDLPNSAEAETDDYMNIGTYGGGSAHFASAGPGIYGFNWWFNSTGRSHPDSSTWPDAPPDVFMSLGARGNCAAIVPSLNLVVTAANADWGKNEPGKRNLANERLKMILEAGTPAVGSP